MTLVTDDEMGGDARIKGRRIAVYHIVQYQDAGFSVEEIAVEFDLDRAKVEEALDYADRNAEEISCALRTTK